MMHRTDKWIQSSLMVSAMALALVPSGVAQTVDLCGCAGNPASLGALDTKDEASWASIGGVRNGSTITIPLPEDGVLIFDSFVVDKLPGGGNSILSFGRNQANTPVTILVAGDVLIGANDIVDLRGVDGQDAAVDTPGYGGLGGPGGSKGGDGGYRAGSLSGLGGAGLGPGGGEPGNQPPGSGSCPGGGDCEYASAGFRGSWLGASDLLPITGGSGGGGGSTSNSSTNAASGGGGGGGGAILLVANGSITINGEINASGGANGFEYHVSNCSGSICSAPGGPGAGGAVRLVGNAIQGTGAVFAIGGADHRYYTQLTRSNGVNGRIRFEAFSIDFPSGTANVSPTAVRVFSPGSIDIPIAPSVAITAVGGAGVVQPPSGWRGSLGPVDVFIATAGPADVEVATSGVPAGTGVDVTVKPRVGGPGVVTSAVVDPGTCDSLGNCVANATLNLDPGRYVIEAQATFQTP